MSENPRPVTLVLHFSGAAILTFIDTSANVLINVNMKETHTMRLQLALNVTDLDAAIDFYSKMFDSTPAKTKPGYANFAIENPPLKLVLFETADGSPSDDFHHLNHLGVEVESAGQVTAAEARITETGIETTGVDDTVCCFAEKTETWVTSPDDARWEWYVKTGDTEQMDHATVATPAASGVCCS
jgi:catechol 2,3-dioxygenase-like lactoylglutathione lyase family enzyme